MDLVRQFYAYYRPWKRLFFLDFGCAVFSGILELAFPLTVAYFIDHLLPREDWPLILLAAAGLLAIYLVNTALMWVVNYWGHMLGINIETELRRRAFDHLQKLPFRYYDNQKTGKLVGRVTKDLEEIGEVAHHGPEDAFIAIMTFLGAFALMFYIEPELALLTALIVPFTAIVTTRFGSKMVRTWRDLFTRVAAFNTRIEENVGGIRVVQAFANEEHERELFAIDNAKYRKAKLRAYRIMSMSMSLNYMGMRLTQLFVMIAGSYFVMAGDLSNGGFVSFLLLVAVFFRPVEKISTVLEMYPKGIAGFRRYLELLNTDPEIEDLPGAVAVDNLRGDIRYEGVSFGYTPDLQILDDLDLTISAGETIAFVGPSGAGKTTISALLPRFYDVESGTITIDGIDIRQMTVASLRREIGIVQQDVYLFGGTLRENIAYGRLDAARAEIDEVVHRARLESMVAQMPDGLDTVIGERGVKLSGGQKQRVAIARMFLKNPPILILDEATSALDSETERQIQQSLADLAVGRTTLVIAHRLATIRNADRIVVITEQGVAEEGTHHELMANHGPYWQLHNAQFGHQEPEPAETTERKSLEMAGAGTAA